MTTTSMRRPARLAGLVLSLTLTGLCLASLPAQAAVPRPAAPAAHQPAGKKTSMQIHAGPVKGKVHRGEQIRIHGHVATGPRGRSDAGDTLYLQTQVQAGVWVNLASAPCAPDSDFDITLAQSTSGTLTLRIFHPETSVFAAAFSDVFAVVVL
ncbi:hypothetical protein [Amycolatopsis benzoatilytica]|uniref:hypothetical protein n=1 Tax=Amycolatopsis benzoatilytica TaxID=346045 RepID=UPI0012B67EBD|nr:hypothetical protein [Amycolatopsis benzoatilytica]